MLFRSLEQPDMAELAQMELEDLQQQQGEHEQQLKLLDRKSVV